MFLNPVVQYSHPQSTANCGTFLGENVSHLELGGMTKILHHGIFLNFDVFSLIERRAPDHNRHHFRLSFHRTDLGMSFY